LHDHGGNLLSAMFVDDPKKIVREFTAMLRLTARKGVARRIVRVPKVIDFLEQRAERGFRIGNSAHGNAAAIDPVIGALASDQPNAIQLSASDMIGPGDLERGLRRFAPRVD